MKIFKYIALVLAVVLAAGCVKEQFELNPDKVPQASDLKVKIDVDQTTNLVTFSIENQGMVPMWLFGEEKIDGKANPKYAYTGNDVQLRFRDDGEHSVEVKAYNAHGVSVGSRIETFTLENTYRDPFNPAPYLKAIAGEWQWNSEVAGHFGCGPSLASPFEWWSAPANDKADWSLYNDRMTFTAEGKYLFNPGEDGKVYVHNSFTELGETPDGNDFMVDIAAYETTYTFENNWNDAGIEEIWLVLPPKKNLSYIPNQQNYDNPRFLVMESKPAAMRKELKLAASEAPNGDALISWYYNFIPAVKVATPEELLAGTGTEGKVWVMDSKTPGHLGCGESPENPAGWWSAPVDDKAGTGLYDDEITFFPDGKYTYNSGPDGKMYVNWGVTVIGPNPGVEPDIDIEWPVTNSTYEFDGETITLAPETPMVYVPSDAMWNNPVFKVVELTETVLKVVAMNEGCYWQMIFRARDVQTPPEPEGPQVAPFDPESADNLWNSATIEKYEYYYAPGWSQITDPEMTLEGRTYTVTLPEATTDQWQAQMKIFTDLTSVAGKKYDFYCVLQSNTDHPGVTVKLTKTGDDGVFYFADRHKLTGYEEYVYVAGGLDGIDMDAMTLVFDFGGNAAGTEVTIKDIVFREAQTVSGGGSEPTFDPNDASNMWLTANTTQMTYYYAPGWTPIDNPGFEADGNNYTITLPEATTDQWQAQVAFANTGMAATADKNYDFYLVMNSTEDHPGVTVKLTQDGDDNLFFFADKHKLTAYEDYVYKVVAMPGINATNLKLVLDFGGNVAGTEVNVKDIIFRESQSTPAPAPEPEVPQPLDPNSDANLWKTAIKTDISYWFADNSWTQIADPELEVEGDAYTLTIPEGTGGSQWQGQFVFNRTGIKTTVGKTYDFQVTLYSEEDHPHVTVKPCYEQAPGNDVNELFIKSDIKLFAYEEYVYTVKGLAGTDIPDLKLVFDLAGAAAGSKVTISGITLIEH